MKKLLVIGLLTISALILVPQFGYACGGDGKSCSCMMGDEGGQCGSGCGCNKKKNDKDINDGE